MAREVLLTQSGYEALVNELEYLKTEKRAELAEKIKVARGFGDLSENSEYDEAKNEQGLVEQRILELEATIKNAKIVNKDNMDVSKVGVGVHVVVVDEDKAADIKSVEDVKYNYEERNKLIPGRIMLLSFNSIHVNKCVPVT